MFISFKKRGGDRRLLFFGLAIFIFILPLAEGYDNYQWINTAIYDPVKASYTNQEADFLADHFDIIVARVNELTGRIRQRNSDAKVITFSYLVTLGAASQQHVQEFFQQYPEYNFYPNNESIFLHYKCDTVVNGELIKGCNLLNDGTDHCSGSPAPGCTASSASYLWESRVPDPSAGGYYQRQGVKYPNFMSQVYRIYGPWLLDLLLSYYEQNGHQSQGIWWDNILYLPGYVQDIQNTIEYFGQPEPPSAQHQYNRDYNNYFLQVKQQTEQQQGRNLLWIGNVNNMFWIRENGPYKDWVLNNLEYFSPESWINSRGFPEIDRPSWAVDCPDLGETWDYTKDRNRKMVVTSYNWFDKYGQDLKTRIFSIVKYYLVKNQNLYFAYSEDSRGNNMMSSEWNKISEINLGQPRQNPSGVKDFQSQLNTDKYFEWNNKENPLGCSFSNRPEVVVARHFDNGLVMARWKAYRCTEDQYQSRGYCDCGPACSQTDVEPRIYNLNNPYSASYYIVQLDGMLSAEPASEISLRTNEAAVLLNVCPNGVVSSTCGCNGRVLNQGQICTYGDGFNITGVDDNESDNTTDDNETVFNIECNDGIDNDFDGFIDFPLDPGCMDLNDDNEMDNIIPQNASCSNGCNAGNLFCSTNSTYLRCSFYDQDPCLEWSSEINCDNGYICEKNKGCVLPEIKEDKLDLEEFIEENEGLAFYSLLALVIIFAGLMIWMLFKRLLYDPNRW